MDLRYEAKWVRTSVSINKEDMDYIKKHGLKVSHLVRWAVRDHRVSTNDPNADVSVRELKRSRDALIDSRQKILTAFMKELGEKKFDEIIQKV